MDQPKSSLDSALGTKSSWIFHCNAVTRRLKAGDPASQLFFQCDALNYAVLTKEILARGEPPRADESPIGTKLFLPFEFENPEKGGRSIMLHSPKLNEFLAATVGLKREVDMEIFENDREILKTIDALPSLDAFLLRDAMALQEIAAHEAYFELSPEERAAIQRFMRDSMALMVRAAFGGEHPTQAKIDHLINTLWEAKNLIALDPLIAALRCPRDDALAIFAAWKGIIFYSFDYQRSAPKRKQLALWLNRNAKPQAGQLVEHAQYHRERVHGIIQNLRHHWVSVDEALKNYDRIYHAFITSMEPGGFIEFLRNAQKVSYAVGIAMGKIGQAIGCLEMMTKGNPDAAIGPINYDILLGQLGAILAPPTIVAPAAA
ncbi:MAG TPA: hypothetical protein VKV32_03240 [Stellaceae bacterium]|nr:hypothetical protein [Stellaceae bacterium]